MLITDGEDHEGDPVAAARDLAERGIKVFVLGVGSRTGETIPTYAPDGTQTGYLRDEQGQLVTTSLTEQNEQQLRQIAEVTGGRYFLAGTLVGALIIQTLTTTIYSIGIPPETTLLFKALVVTVVCLLQSPAFREKVFRTGRHKPAVAPPRPSVEPKTEVPA